MPLALDRGLAVAVADFWRRFATLHKGEDGRTDRWLDEQYCRLILRLTIDGRNWAMADGRPPRPATPCINSHSHVVTVTISSISSYWRKGCNDYSPSTQKYSYLFWLVSHNVCEHWKLPNLACPFCLSDTIGTSESQINSTWFISLPVVDFLSISLFF